MWARRTRITGLGSEGKSVGPERVSVSVAGIDVRTRLLGVSLQDNIRSIDMHIGLLSRHGAPLPVCWTRKLETCFSEMLRRGKLDIPK